jgi:hypothetical protein
MFRIGSSVAWLAAGVLTAVVVCVGCGEQPNPVVGPVAPVPLNPQTPAESFLVILDTFKRGIENVPASFVATGENGHSMLTATNKVSHELLSPTEGEPYRAKIIVTSSSRFSMQRNEPDEEKNRKGDKNPNKNNSANLNDPAADPSNSEDEADFSGLTTGAKKRLSAADGEVARATDESVRTYDLVFRDGRWTLVTKLDDKTEKSIQNAFDHALATQP